MHALRIRAMSMFWYQEITFVSAWDATLSSGVQVTPFTRGKKRKSLPVRGEERMLEYFAYALLGLLVIGCILYVTLSPEVEEPPAPKGPDPKL